MESNRKESGKLYIPYIEIDNVRNPYRAYIDDANFHVSRLCRIIE